MRESYAMADDAMYEVPGTRLRELTDEIAGQAAEITRLRGQIAEKNAAIDRLQAELDGLREVPVEYVTPGALKAAMTADPAREDGAILRETSGEKRAFQWQAGTREWAQIT
jgi:uncharacterized coiled-coil protein SlyX